LSVPNSVIALATFSSVTTASPEAECFLPRKSRTNLATVSAGFVFCDTTSPTISPLLLIVFGTPQPVVPSKLTPYGECGESEGASNVNEDLYAVFPKTESFIIH